MISITAGLTIISMVGCATVDTQTSQKQAETLAALSKKAEQFKGSTLVFKGFYLGMPKKDAVAICDIQKLTKAAVYSPEGKLIELHLNSEQIKQLFGLTEINPGEFVNRFAREYKTPPPEYLPGDMEVDAGGIGRKEQWKITDGKSYEIWFASAPAPTTFMSVSEPSRLFTLTLKRVPGSFN